MFKAWQFWFTIIGAAVTWALMYGTLKVDQAKTDKTLFHVQQDVKEIKENIRDIRDRVFEKSALNLKKGH